MTYNEILNLRNLGFTPEQITQLNGQAVPTPVTPVTPAPTVPTPVTPTPVTPAPTVPTPVTPTPVTPTPVPTLPTSGPDKLDTIISILQSLNMAAPGQAPTAPQTAEEILGNFIN